MNEVDIVNPTEDVEFEVEWSQLKSAINQLTKYFPKEYSIVSDNVSKMMFLVTALKETDRLVGGDQIIYIECLRENKPSLARFTITNEKGKIGSFGELKRNEKSFIIFFQLLKKELAGTLKTQLANNAQKQRQVNEAKKTDQNISGFIQLLLLIVALAAIIMGLKALF